MNLSKQCVRLYLWYPRLATCSRQKCRYLLPHRSFHSSTPLAIIKPFLLPDIGEGIKEVQIIQWFVEPEARVEQFDKICEVQSDKAAAEITSRFDGVVKKLHYNAEDMAQVGKPLCDIDVQNEIEPEKEAIIPPQPKQAGSAAAPQQPQKDIEQHQPGTAHAPEKTPLPVSRHASLATPAVRGLLRELEVNITDVTGTGRDGRVLKDDVHKFAANRDTTATLAHPVSLSQSSSTENAAQEEKPIAFTPIQTQMFKTMTRSLGIPHFLYADEIDITPLSTLRLRLKSHPHHPQKLSYLPFIIKAVSLALTDFPLLNSRVEADQGGSNTQQSSPPQLIIRKNHNIGVAMDTPQGLLVPNIKNVATLSILSIASEISRLQALALGGNLAIADLTGGTITVSNVGSIGGTYVAPVLVTSEVAILGIGKAKTVPAFNEAGALVKKEVMNFSWSADHRVIDGATMARMAERVRGFVEEPARMMLRLR